MSTKTSTWVPLHLQIMLQAYVEGVPFVHPSESRGKFIKALRDADLVEMQGGSLQPTEKGTAFVKMLCHTPVPVEVHKFIDPRTNKEPGAETET